MTHSFTNRSVNFLMNKYYGDSCAAGRVPNEHAQHWPQQPGSADWNDGSGRCRRCGTQANPPHTPPTQCQARSTNGVHLLVFPPIMFSPFCFFYRIARKWTVGQCWESSYHPILEYSWNRGGGGVHSVHLPSMCILLMCFPQTMFCPRVLPSNRLTLYSELMYTCLLAHFQSVPLRVLRMYVHSICYLHFVSTFFFNAFPPKSCLS